MHRVQLGNEHCDAFGDRSTQQGANSESLSVDAPGSSHMSSLNGEQRILSVHVEGEGPLAVNGHDTRFTASELEALSSLSADHVHREQQTVQLHTPVAVFSKNEEDIGGGMDAEVDNAMTSETAAHSVAPTRRVCVWTPLAPPTCPVTTGSCGS
ncbi:unnamed protein product [Gadus morhua 'NCC']